MYAGEGAFGPRKRGQRPKLDEQGERALFNTYVQADLTARQVAKMFGVSRATLHKIVARHRKNAPGSDKPGGDAPHAGGADQSTPSGTRREEAA